MDTERCLRPLRIPTAKRPSELHSRKIVDGFPGAATAGQTDRGMTADADQTPQRPCDGIQIGDTIERPEIRNGAIELFRQFSESFNRQVASIYPARAGYTHHLLRCVDTSDFDASPDQVHGVHAGSTPQIEHPMAGV